MNIKPYEILDELTNGCHVKKKDLSSFQNMKCNIKELQISVISSFET